MGRDEANKRKTRENLTAIKSDIKMWCLESWSIWHVGALKPLSDKITVDHVFESKFNHQSVIKAFGRPWNNNFLKLFFKLEIETPQVYRQFTATVKQNWNFVARKKSSHVGYMWAHVWYGSSLRFVDFDTTFLVLSKIFLKIKGRECKQ